MSSFLVVHLPQGRSAARMIEYANIDGFSWSVCSSMDEMTYFVNDVWKQLTAPPNLDYSSTETRIKQEEYDPGELIVDNFQVKYRAAGVLDQQPVDNLDSVSDGQNTNRSELGFPQISQIPAMSFFSELHQPTECRPVVDDLKDFEMSEDEEEKEASKEPVPEKYERIGRRYYCARTRLPDPGDIFQSLTSESVTFSWPPGLVIPRPRLPHEIRQEESAWSPEVPSAVRDVVDQMRSAAVSTTTAPRNTIFPEVRAATDAGQIYMNEMRLKETSSSSASRNTILPKGKAAPRTELSYLDEGNEELVEVEDEETTSCDISKKKPEKPSSRYTYIDDDFEEEESEDEVPRKDSSSDEYIDSDWERKQGRINKQLNKPPPRVYSCWVKNCGASFPSQPKLAKHITAEHPGKKPWTCTECRKQFQNRRTLLEHNKISHSDAEPSHKCPECDKAFHRNDYLKIHLRLHTGELPYECKKCGKKFSDHANYQVHLRVHTPKRVKPYRCKYCKAKYRHSPTLTHHIRKHHPEELEKDEDD